MNQLISCVSMTYCAALIDFCSNKGADRQSLLDVAQLQAHMLDDANAVVEMRHFVALFNHILTLYPDESLAYELASSSKLTSHGFLGYALMCSATIEEVIDITVRYLPIRTTMVRASKHIDTTSTPPMMCVHINDQTLLGAARHVFFNALTLELSEALRFLVGQAPIDLEIWLDYPESTYFKAWQDKLPKTLFNQNNIQIRIPMSQLNTPVSMSNPSAQKMAIAQCEQALQCLLSIEQPENTAVLVKQLLEDMPHFCQNITRVASQLNMSERTLKRRLQAHNTNFQSIFNQVRQDNAIHLLTHSDISIERIALELGYTDQANFTRAFKKWTGLSPKDARITYRTQVSNVATS